MTDEAGIIIEETLEVLQLGELINQIKIMECTCTTCCPADSMNELFRMSLVVLWGQSL